MLAQPPTRRHLPAGLKPHLESPPTREAPPPEAPPPPGLPGPPRLTQQAQAAAGLPQRGGAVSAAERAIGAVQRPQQAGQLPQEFLLCVRACGEEAAAAIRGAAGPAAPAPPPPSARILNAPWPAPSPRAPSSRLSTAPRAVSSAASRAHSALKSAHAGPRDAASGRAPYLRRGARQCECLPPRPRPERLRPTRAPGHTARTPHPKVSRSPATVAPSMAASRGHPGRAPLSARDRLRPPRRLLPPPPRRYPITFSCEGASALRLGWQPATRAPRATRPGL